MINTEQFNKALDGVGNVRAELAEIYSAISEMSRPLNSDKPSEKAELDSLFLASDAVRAAQRQLAACSDKLLTAIVAEKMANA